MVLSDYFFQTEMADQFNQHGYDFYALDLRKYGRFAFVTSALVQRAQLV